VDKNDWPRYTWKRSRKLYEPEELDELFSALQCRRTSSGMSSFLMTGMREQEVMYSATGRI
jgi:hypothetical protein